MAKKSFLANKTQDYGDFSGSETDPEVSDQELSGDECDDQGDCPGDDESLDEEAIMRILQQKEEEIKRKEEQIKVQQQLELKEKSAGNDGKN